MAVNLMSSLFAKVTACKVTYAAISMLKIFRRKKRSVGFGQRRSAFNGRSLDASSYSVRCLPATWV